MAAPTLSWDLVRLYGTWHNLNGTLKAGSYTITIPARVTSATDDDIVPAGTFLTGTLATSVGSPSLDIMIPATDDPDIAETGWTVHVTVTFNDNSATENYVISVPYANRPTASGGNNQGVNLRTIALAGTVPQENPLYKIGVAGGLAQLNASGLVTNADGSTPSGGGSTDVAAATHSATSKTTPVDADEFPGTDSAASFGLKKFTWANIKATMKSYLDGVGVAKLSTARTIAGVSFDGTGNISIRHDQLTVPTADVDWGGVKITNVATPGSANDVASKSYVDSGLSGKMGSSAALAISQLPAGSVLRVIYTGSAWPARPTARTDITVLYLALTVSDPAPSDFVAGVDYLLRPTS